MSEEKKKLEQLLRSRRWPIEDVVDHQRKQEALRALELKASIEKHAASIAEGLDVTTKEAVVDAVTQVRAELEAERRLAERVLTHLPQGDGSGLDADMVDGLHADEVAVKAAEIAQAGSGSMFGITDHGLLQGLADDDHTQYFPVNGTRAADQLGVGVVPPVNYRSVIRRDATDTIGLYVDGLTNPYSGTALTQAIFAQLGIAAGSTTVNLIARALGFSVNQQRDMSIPAFGSLTWSVAGLSGTVTDYGDFAGGSGFGELGYKTIDGLVGIVTQSSIQDTANADTTLTQRGGYFNSMVATPTINKAGGTFTINHYGGYAYAQITNPTLTAGTLVVNTYGLYGEAIGHATGTEKAYGVYGKASGADDNYAGYFEGDTMHTADVFMPNLPVADPAVAGQLWNDGGILKISAG